MHSTVGVTFNTEQVENARLEWNIEAAVKVANAFTHRAGLQDVSLSLVRFRQNALFRLPNLQLTVRIYSPLEDPSRAKLMVDCARALESRGFPAVRLWHQIHEQPVNILGYEVSVWKWIEQEKRNADAFHAFGQLIRRLHDLDGKFDADIPAFDPLIKIRRRIERLNGADNFPAEYRAVLRDALHIAEDREATLRDTMLGMSVIHGDALLGNTIHTATGLQLIDFDSVCFGPREWDLVPSLIAAERFGRGMESWSAFLRGYGIAPEQLAQLEAANVVKQLSMTVVLCLQHGQSVAVDREIARRMSHWKQWDFNSRWYTPSDRAAR